MKTVFAILMAVVDVAVAVAAVNKTGAQVRSKGVGRGVRGEGHR